MTKQQIVGAVASVTLVGAGMFGAGSLVGNDGFVGAGEEVIEKVNDTSFKVIDSSVKETVVTVAEAKDRIEKLTNIKSMNLIKITGLQDDNTGIDEEIAKLESQLADAESKGVIVD